MKKYGLIIGLFVFASILVYFFSNNYTYTKTGNLYISEILASNSYTYKDKDGDYSDYIEIYNGNSYDINLDGYYLTDKLTEVKKWAFPNIQIDANEYLIIFASGRNICEEKDNCHTNFKLNKSGEVISLIDNTGNIISRIGYKDLSNDISISFVKNKYLETVPTPGKENSNEIITKKDISKYKIKFNEYLSHNKGSSYSNNGIYYDWVELYNASDEDLSIDGLYLSDNEENLNKFKLGNYTIKSKDYLVIYLTGGEEIDGIYANFRLSDDDKKLILSMDGKIIDEVDIISLPDNVSYGQDNGKWYYYFSPTPGMANTTAKRERLGKDGSS